MFIQIFTYLCKRTIEANKQEINTLAMIKRLIGLSLTVLCSLSISSAQELFMKPTELLTKPNTERIQSKYYDDWIFEEEEKEVSFIEEEDDEETYNYVALNIGTTFFYSNRFILGGAIDFFDFNQTFFSNWGLKIQAGSNITINFGNTHALAGLSYSYSLFGSVGTTSVLVGMAKISAHSDERGHGGVSSDTSIALGMSYEHRFFTSAGFNLILGADAKVFTGFATLYPKIGVAYSW